MNIFLKNNYLSAYKTYWRRYLRNDKRIHFRENLQIMVASECTSHNDCGILEWHLVPVIVFCCLLFLFLFLFFFGGGGIDQYVFVLPLLIFGGCVIISRNYLSFLGAWVVHPVFGGVNVQAICVCFVDFCMSFCPFSFGHCIVSFFD